MSLILVVFILRIRHPIQVCQNIFESGGACFNESTCNGEQILSICMRVWVPLNSVPIYPSSCPLYLVKVFLFISLCAFSLRFDDCVHQRSLICARGKHHSLAQTVTHQILKALSSKSVYDYLLHSIFSAGILFSNLHSQSFNEAWCSLLYF